MESATSDYVEAGLVMSPAERKNSVRTSKDQSPRRLRMRAQQAVSRATRSGELPSLADGATRCTDCDNPANCYDHRNYYHPLAVDPVCTGCNIRRGPGFPLNPDGDEYTSWVARKLGGKPGYRWGGLAGGVSDANTRNGFKSALHAEKSVGDFIDEHWITYEPDLDCQKMIQEARLRHGKRCHYGFQKSFVRGLYDWYGIEPV